MTAALNIPKVGKMTLTASEYHAHSAVGSSSLKQVLRSPAHYKWYLENPEPPTQSQAFGSAAHEAVLEPNLFKSTAVVMPKFKGKGSQEAKEKWKLQAGSDGKRILKAEEMADIQLILKSLSNHRTARGLLSGGAAEESYFDECPETGLLRKARPDFFREGVIVDVKTTTDASPKSFTREIANYLYHVSAAYYLDVVGSVVGQSLEHFIIIAAEKTAPYGVSVHRLDEGTIEAGRFLYKKALRTLKDCKDTNTWPCYPDEILNTAIPHWAFPEEG